MKEELPGREDDWGGVVEEKGSRRAVDFEAAVLWVDPALLLRREEERMGVFLEEEMLLLVDEVCERFVQSASGFLPLLPLLLLITAASIVFEG